MPSRRIQAKRRAKKAAGLDGLIPSFLPEVPSVKTILRQLLAGLFSRGLVSRKRIVKKHYEWTDKGRKELKVDMTKAFNQAAQISTAQSAMQVLGEVIFSTPIITSALAQGWKLTTGKTAGVFNPKVPKLNHGQVFSQAQTEASPELQRVMKSVKQHQKIPDITITNPAPYLEEARPASYWRYIINNAWTRQARMLQKTFDTHAKRMFGSK